MLTAARLKELLRYDPDTGEFFRLIAQRCQHGGVGEIAGTLERDGYIQIGIDGRRYKAHHLAVLYMTGVSVPEIVDHIDGDTSNNRWSNLRCCSITDNNRHTRLRQNNTSGVKGVSFDKRCDKWRASITVDRVQYNLGRFYKFEDAVAARVEAEKLYGFTHIPTPNT